MPTRSQSRSRKRSRSCPSGQIRRKSYKRRRPGSSKRSIRVSSKCVRDMGRPGRGRKTLPEPNPERSLSRFGYKVHASTSERQKALRKASEKYGSLAVLRRLNLIRNYQAVQANKDKMSEDVQYMSNYHAQQSGQRLSRSSKRRSNKSRKSRKSKRSRRGSKKGSRKGSIKGSKKGSRKGSIKGSKRRSRK